MPILVIQHPGGGTAGVFADEARARGADLVAWTPGAGEPLPPGGLEAFAAVVVLGGGQNVEETSRYPFLADEIALLRGALERRQPLLGVCLGHQLLAAAAGAEVRAAPRLEMGLHGVRRTAAGAADPLLAALPDAFTAYGWHSYEVALGEGLVPLAESDVSPQALRFGPCAWGVQFHPEVDRAILTSWYAEWASDPAIPRDFDAAAELARVFDGLDAWAVLGRRLFGRWLELVG